jgi:hypothetical protein
VADTNGDGIPDRVCLYGDKSADSDIIHSIIIEVYIGQTELGTQVITELNGYNPTLFLGDFTKDKVDDIFLRMDLMFNSLNSKDKGAYGASVDTYNGQFLETIFASDRYNDEYPFIVEYNDLYKVSVANVKENKLFFLDISYKGYDYLSQYYNEEGKLIKPVKGQVLGVNPIIPVVSSTKDNSYDLLAVHRVIGSSDSDTLGYLQNLLSWDGKWFVSVNMMAAAPGTDLIPSNQF